MSKLPNPKTLIFMLSTPDRYRKPLFSSQEIFCGPDTETSFKQGMLQSLKTPSGRFDIQDVINQLPHGWHPELIIVKADSSNRIFPQNLKSLNCKKVLILGITHIFKKPIQRLIQYAQSEPYDLFIADHMRHHLHYYQEAGLKNVHWLPALNLRYLEKPINPSPSIPLSFSGQTGIHHPYRHHVLTELLKADLPLRVFHNTPEEASQIYANSQISLNISLNGDLNLRVFEILASGGFLITDKLSQESGLYDLFNPEEHLEVFSSPEELKEKVRWYLDHPDKILAIKKAGQTQLKAHHAPEVTLTHFHDLAFSDKTNALFDLSQDPRHQRSPRENRERCIALYQYIQEVHRKAIKPLQIICDPRSFPLIQDCADLPRIQIIQVPENGCEEWLQAHKVNPHDILIISTAPTDTLLCEFKGNHLILSQSIQDHSVLLNAYGFQSHNDIPRLLIKEHRIKNIEQTLKKGSHSQAISKLSQLPAEELPLATAIRAAQLAISLENLRAALSYLYQAHRIDRSDEKISGALTQALIQLGNYPEALVLMEEIQRYQKLPERCLESYKELKETPENYNSPSYQSYIQRVYPAPKSQSEKPLRILIITNLFPPQEMGGYGRKMWEFARILKARGHEIRVLCGNAPYLLKHQSMRMQELEPHTSRCFKLLGRWVGGITEAIEDEAVIIDNIRKNKITFEREMNQFHPDVCLAGNVDFLTHFFFAPLLDQHIPILHCVGYQHPGYPPEAVPQSPLFRFGPASHWVGNHTIANKYPYKNYTTIYPGASSEEFYYNQLPSLDELRICFASIILPYKGPQILLESLVYLLDEKIPFHCEIAGDSTDPEYFDQIKTFVDANNLGKQIRFTGFLNRKGLRNLFARSNVLVFPSQCQEAFGISQVEAMASGLTVISSGTGGSKEIITHEKNGLIFTPDSAIELAEQLKSLPANKQRWKALCQEAQKRAFELSAQKSVNEIEKTFDELLAISKIKKAQL